jgi:hypothetical protein
VWHTVQRAHAQQVKLEAQEGSRASLLTRASAAPFGPLRSSDTSRSGVHTIASYTGTTCGRTRRAAARTATAS